MYPKAEYKMWEVNLKECIQEALERYDRYTANENMSHAGMAQPSTN